MMKEYSNYKQGQVKKQIIIINDQAFSFFVMAGSYSSGTFIYFENIETADKKTKQSSKL